MCRQDRSAPKERHIMRLLRGLGSQLLPCGCLAGVYETYAGTTVSIIDARGDSCDVDAHRPGLLVPAGPTRAAIPVPAGSPDNVERDRVL
jgi:hypothetical protein